MNTTNETIGLRVLNTVPINKAANVNVNKGIEIQFSAALNAGTIPSNIVVLEDINGVFEDVSSLSDYSQYAVVNGSVSYDDAAMTVIYTPSEPFHVDTCYIFILNDEITDITGNKLIKKYLSCFYTEKVASFPKCEFTSPKYGAICNAIPEFTWKNLGAPSYRFQVSKVNTFESLIVDAHMTGAAGETVSYTPSFNINEGIYHIRVSAENGEWSDVHQIFIQAITDAVIAQEDTPVFQNFDEFIDGLVDPLEILEIFPAEGSTNISLKTATFYIKMKGKIDPDRIDFSSAFVYGESTDEEHDEYSHGLVDGEWIWIYDPYIDATFIVFKIKEETSEQEGDPAEETDEPQANPEEPTEGNEENQGSGDGSESGNTDESGEDNTEVPVNTEEPFNTDEPSNTEEPTGTDEPDNPEEPVNTEEPGNIEEPGNTENTGEQAQEPTDTEPVVEEPIEDTDTEPSDTAGEN